MIFTETYNLPSFWASALVNGDESGMSDQEVEVMNKWLEKNKPGRCVDVSEDDGNFMAYHDARGYVLACDCCVFTFEYE